jgi:hypothetical protein
MWQTEKGSPFSLHKTPYITIVLHFHLWCCIARIPNDTCSQNIIFYVDGNFTRRINVTNNFMMQMCCNRSGMTGLLEGKGEP